MSLLDVQRNWNELAKKDAMWAVLTGPVGSGREWDTEAFFRTGVEEIQWILERAREVGGAHGKARALDFGCGVGRLTQALCGHFDHVDGVDIAEAMIERARALNRHGDRCRYHLNDRDDLRAFADGTFDFVYSNITLQHMPAEYSRRYIQEFFRIVRRGGVVVFQIPSDMVADSRPRTYSTAPLPDAACRASIETAPRLRCTAGEKVILRVVVRNTGDQVWPARGHDDGAYSIRLGNHWRNWFGRMLTFNDARAMLPHDVPPGESVEIGLQVPVPAAPGRYVLELDMVQEHVRWFAEAGSRTTRLRVRALPASTPADGDQAQSASMEMHGILRSEVESLIASSGATLLAVDANDSAGPAWNSYRYIATR